MFLAFGKLTKKGKEKKMVLSDSKLIFIYSYKDVSVLRKKFVRPTKQTVIKREKYTL